MPRKTILGLALALGADALRTRFTVSDLQQIAASNAALESNYHEVLASSLQPDGSTAADIDPSLLYPAYNLSVPIDHFHNDSLYEPHVCSLPPQVPLCLLPTPYAMHHFMVWHYDQPIIHPLS